MGIHSSRLTRTEDGLGEAQYTPEEKARRDDLHNTFLSLLGFVVAGVLLIILRFAVGTISSLIQKKGSVIHGNAFTCLLWGFGWFAAAFVFGFLFGIPKVLQNIPKENGLVTKSDRASDTGNEHVNPLKVNTNLEEISDWLTKILVGATLTQLIKLPQLVSSASSYMARGIGGPEYETVAAATMLYFTSIGFFSGYVLTRMFFSLAFASADKGPVFPDFLSIKQTSIALGVTPNRAKENGPH